MTDNVTGDVSGGVTGGVTGWLASRAVPLDGLDPRAPLSDLRPLREVLAGARVVGLGEATHGTREFFLLKHRLLRFLVEELGCTVLAMEASVSASAALDAYVLGGPGDPERLLAGLGFWTWHTAEMLAVVEWMREHNRTAERKVRFAGIDPQFPGASLHWLRDRVGGLPEPLAALEDRRLGLSGPLGPEVEEAARRLEERVAGDAEAARHALTVRQFATLMTRPFRHADPSRTASAARDAFMADNVGRLLAGPGVKVAVWAHNGHISTRGPGDGEDPGEGKGLGDGEGLGEGKVASMGTYLRQRHGDDYYALGLLFGQGEFRARRLRLRRPQARKPPVRHRVPAVSRPDLLEHRLATACPADHVVDLRTGDKPEPVRDWLRSPQHMRSFGALAGRWTYKMAFSPVVPGEDFDGLAYVARGTCSTPL